MLKRQKINSFAFSLTEVLIAKRERGKMSLLNPSRTRELKAPPSRFLKQCAFTLAEVLITLVIIGVVAALTIPTLVNNYQKTEYLTALKKAYAGFNQVLIQISADKGCVGDLACTGLFASDSTQKTLGDELVKYLKIVKNCEDTGAGCFSDNVSPFYDGSGLRNNVYETTTGYRFIAEDGASYLIYNEKDDNGADCISNYSTSGKGALSQLCGDLYIDVNGPTKGPNNFGRDIFYFYITNGKGPMLYPRGGSDDNMDSPWNSGNIMCGSNIDDGNEDSSTCAGRIIEEGWQMKY